MKTNTPQNVSLHYTDVIDGLLSFPNRGLRFQSGYCYWKYNASFIDPICMLETDHYFKMSISKKRRKKYNSENHVQM